MKLIGYGSLQLCTGAVPAMADWDGGVWASCSKIIMQSGCQNHLKTSLEFLHPHPMMCPPSLLPMVLPMGMYELL